MSETTKVPTHSLFMSVVWLMQFGFSLRNLRVLCVSVVNLACYDTTAETQSTLRLRRESKTASPLKRNLDRFPKDFMFQLTSEETKH